MTTHLRPLLAAEHFVDVEATLALTGLTYDATFSEVERRENAQQHAGQELDDADESPIRGSSRCVIHPDHLTADQLRVHLERELEGDDAGININYGLGESWALNWSMRQGDIGPVEGQDLVVVCFGDDGQPVGFASLDLSLTRCEEGEAKDLVVRVEAQLVYVSPSRRGQGYGVDLSVACGHIVCAVLAAAYRAADPGWSIEPYIYADFESRGGERFSQFLWEELMVQSDYLREDVGRSDVHIKEVDFEAGY